jgi:hypothetical protein
MTGVAYINQNDISQFKEIKYHVINVILTTTIRCFITYERN